MTKPTVTYSGTPTSGTVPLSVTFTDTSTQSPTSYVWDFDNSGTTDSTTKSPTYIYNTPGTYTVLHSATNASGTTTVSKTDYITASAPTLEIVSDKATGDAPLTVTFGTTGSTAGATATRWDYGSGWEASATKVFATPGTYTVKLGLTYGTAGEFTHTHAAMITVTRPLPVAAISCNKTGVAPFTVTFGDASTGFDITDRAWHVTDKHGSAIYTTASATYTFTKPGRYPVSYSVTNATGTSTVTEYITVGTYTSALPEASRIVDKRPISMAAYVDKTNGVEEWMAANDKVIQDAKGDMCKNCSYVNLGARCPMFQTDLCDKIRKVGVSSRVCVGFCVGLFSVPI